MPNASSTALRLTGRDTLAVLHRVTTQSLADLPPGAARTTLFCDFRGRLQHRALVVHAPDGAVWLLRDDAPGDELAAAVDRSVFREDVRIEDRSDAFAVRLVEHAADAPAFATDGTPVTAPEGGGLALSLAAGDTLSEAETIARGRARARAEIAEAFTPYEVNLAAHVHLAKGCYTGQETLQRLVTYESVRRRLVRFAGEGAPPAPQELLAAGEPAGALTRSAASGSGWLALAVARIDALDSGAAFALADGTALPPPHAFTVPRPLGRP